MNLANIELKPLYRVRFQYPEGWGVELGKPGSQEGQYFFIAEGSCEGRIQGTFRGANNPSRRGDGTFVPDFQGVIETGDGAQVYFDYRGYGRAHPPGRREIVVVATHLCQDERYLWLNDTVAVGVGEVRSQPEAETELVIDWAEVIWAPIPD